MLYQSILVLALMVQVEKANAQTIAQNRTGIHDGFYYSFWNDATSGSASMTLEADGRYSTKWNTIGNFTAGKGWSTGKENRIINFSGEFDGGSNGFLAVYGWTKDQLVEYYVVENYGSWTPPGATTVGSFVSDGGTYNIYKTQRVNKPSIVGITSFRQYWSVRTQKRTSGTVTFANHIRAWQNKGMYMGKIWDYQIMETEGYGSSGYSNIAVSEGKSEGKKR